MTCIVRLDTVNLDYDFKQLPRQKLLLIFYAVLAHWQVWSFASFQWLSLEWSSNEACIVDCQDLFIVVCITLCAWAEDVKTDISVDIQAHGKLPAKMFLCLTHPHETSKAAGSHKQLALTISKADRSSMHTLKTRPHLRPQTAEITQSLHLWEALFYSLTQPKAIVGLSRPPSTWFVELWLCLCA